MIWRITLSSSAYVRCRLLRRKDPNHRLVYVCDATLHEARSEPRLLGEVQHVNDMHARVLLDELIGRELPTYLANSQTVHPR